jgi:hypothetical protein
LCGQTNPSTPIAFRDGFRDLSVSPSVFLLALQVAARTLRRNN